MGLCTVRHVQPVAGASDLGMHEETATTQPNASAMQKHVEALLQG